MKKLLTLLFAFSGLFMSSCSKDNGSSTRTCDVTTDPYTTPEGGATVEYSVSASGTANVSTIKFQGGSGPGMVSNPSLPFDTTVTLLSGIPVTLEAIGTTQSGTITVTYNATFSGGNAENSQSCGN